MIDPDQMKQVFWNLLINAAQAMSNGGEISIHLKKENGASWGNGSAITRTEKGKEWVKISITDSGNGITRTRKREDF